MSFPQPSVTPTPPIPDEVYWCVERGHNLSQAGRFDEAEQSYRKAIELKSDVPMAHNNLGWVRQMQGDNDAAVASYRLALKLDPNLRIARRNLAPLLVSLGRIDESIGVWHAEMLSGPDGQQWVDEMISAAMGARDLTRAGEYAELFARIRWGSDWYPPRPNGSGPPLSLLPNEVFLTIPKLAHDVEQFLYLQRRGIFGDELTPIIDDYRKVIERLMPAGNEARVQFDNETQSLIGHIYNRIIHVRKTPRVERALSDRWDRKLIESQYLDRPPGVVVIDDFLSTKALEELRLFCLESTVWSANRYFNGRLGAFFRDGFNCPLLLQIAEELRSALPRVIGDRYPLRQLWGFKNTQQLPADSTTHADFAAVNVNFWIMPSEGNLDPNTGGLVVYEVDAPLEWDFLTYNGHMDLIRAYLRHHQARKVTIPYRANRAIIFNSDLFHGTESVNFGPGYENWRMNITMLYGHRENDVHHGRLTPNRTVVHPQPAWRSASFARTRRR